MGNCFLARYADDFVMGFSLKSDAERVFKVLPKRFERFGLSIHPEKSWMVQFSRPYWRKGKGPGTFAFLGFTHYWAKALKGGWQPDVCLEWNSFSQPFWSGKGPEPLGLWLGS